MSRLFTSGVQSTGVSVSASVFGQTPGEVEDRETWSAAVHGVAKSQKLLGD